MQIRTAFRENEYLTGNCVALNLSALKFLKSAPQTFAINRLHFLITRRELYVSDNLICLDSR